MKSQYQIFGAPEPNFDARYRLSYRFHTNFVQNIFYVKIDEE